LSYILSTISSSSIPAIFIKMASQKRILLDRLRGHTPETLTWQYDMVRKHDAHYLDHSETDLNQAQYQEVPIIQSTVSHPVKGAIIHSELPIDAHSAEHTDPSTTPLAIRSTLASWSLELLAVVVSVSSITAIIAVLYRENNQPLTAWRFGITLNTIIAALGTLARTTLAFAISACIGQQRWSWLRRRPDRLVAFERFDEASKGPYGALQLFAWLRMRYSYLGVLPTSCM
jgi:hypothetical protein